MITDLKHVRDNVEMGMFYVDEAIKAFGDPPAEYEDLLASLRACTEELYCIWYALKPPTQSELSGFTVPF